MQTIKHMLKSVKKALAEAVGKDLQWRHEPPRGAALIASFLLPLSGEAFTGDQLAEAFEEQHHAPPALARQLSKHLREAYAAPSAPGVRDLRPAANETIGEVRC